MTVKADVSEAEDVRAMVEFVGERFGGLDILVSNAATGGFRPLRDVTPAQFDAAMHTNVRALLYLIQASRDLLGRDRGGDRGRAKVVALSSHGSRLALPDYGMIGASKAALESLVRQLSLEFGNSGINFNVVLAGPVETDSTRALPDAENLFRGSRERMLTSGAALTVDPVADAVLFLASGLSDFVQGQTIVVDGGLGVAG